MHPELRAYTLRYSYSRALAQSLLTLIKENDENRLWSTRELHSREPLSSYSYGSLLMTILEMSHRGVLTIAPPSGSELDFSVRYRSETDANSRSGSTNPARAGANAR